VDRRKRRQKQIAIGLGGYVLISLILLVGAGFGAVTLILGSKIAGFESVSRQEADAALAQANPELVRLAEAAIGDEVRAALDCASFAPAARRPGENCLDGLMLSAAGDNPSPIPASAAWKLPIWQAAARRYRLPWQLLAAAEGARSYFGTINCQSGDGSGSYRLSETAWRRYAVDAGSTVLERDGANCWRAISPAEAPVGASNRAARLERKRYEIKIYPESAKPLLRLSADRRPEPGRADRYDPVDATWSFARQLAEQGGFGKRSWDYSGSPANQCTAPPSDGRLWYVPELDLGYGAGARIGFNGRLDIPRAAALLAAKYRSNSGKYKPRRDGFPIDDRLGDHRIPKRDIEKLLRAAWSAFGYRGQELNMVVTLNYAQVGLESGGRPYILQGIIGDVNDDNPAGGLFQFIPSTFDHWNVDGFNDRFNPLDNILAAVNAQVNGPYPTLNGRGGWSPPFSENPYASGGRSRLVGGSETSSMIVDRPYQGKPQIDPLSRALRWRADSGSNSDCYIAVVNQWYREIKANPPSASITGGLRERIVKIAQSELKRGVSETSGDNVPRYRNGEITPYSISDAWCQAFASRIWYWAGIRKLREAGGMVGADGLALPVSVAAMTSFGQENFKYKTGNPLPGDMIMYGAAHLGIVERVSPSGQVLSTIEGNASDAVIRVTGSGISRATHYIEPPASAGAPSYSFAISPTTNSPKLLREFELLQIQLGVRAGLALAAGDQARLLGAVSSAKAWAGLEPALAFALIESGVNLPASAELFWPRLVRRNQGSEARAALAVQAVLQKAGDFQTRINLDSGQFSPLSQTYWSPEASNQFYAAWKSAKLTRGWTRAEKAALKRYNYRPSLEVWGPDDDYNRRFLLRLSDPDLSQALTVIVISSNLAEARRAARKIRAWAIQKKIVGLDNPANSQNSNSGSSDWL